MFQELDIVRLKIDDIDTGVLSSYTGTIVDVVAESQYTVDFVNADGETIVDALYKIYTADELIKV